MHGSTRRIGSENRDGSPTSSAGDLRTEQTDTRTRFHHQAQETIGTIAAEPARSIARVRANHELSQLHRALIAVESRAKELGEPTHTRMLVYGVRGRRTNRVPAVGLDARHRIRDPCITRQELTAEHPRRQLIGEL